MHTVIEHLKEGQEVTTFDTEGQAYRYARSKNNVVTIAPTELLIHSMNPRDYIMGHSIPGGGILTYNTGRPINSDTLWAQIIDNGSAGDKFPVVYKRMKRGIRVMYGGDYYWAKERVKIPV